MAHYYIQENKGQYQHELQWLVMSKTKNAIASHTSKETALLHVDNNNKRWPKGCNSTYKTFKTLIQ